MMKANNDVQANANTNYLVIKLSNKHGELDNMSLEQIVQRAAGEWYITYAKVADLKHAIVMYHGLILAECRIGGKIMVNHAIKRVSFELSTVAGSGLMNQHMNVYKGANPVTVKTLSEICEMIEASRPAA